MAITDLFSKRQRRARGEVPDVYKYDELPRAFRVQVLHIIRDVMGEDNYQERYTADGYAYVVGVLLREYGLLRLSERTDVDKLAVTEFFLGTSDVEQALDVIELFFKLINTYVKSTDYRSGTRNRILSHDAATNELNKRFQESGIGYQYESGQVIRIDSAYLHAEAVKPALGVLSDPRFKGANEEFLAAHEHYRHGRNEECLVECCKAFESTMKTICTERGWSFKATDTAKTLIATCLANGLIPSYLDNQITSLRTLFESGIPTVRNKAGGHGQGAVPRVVPEFLARYVLNQTATTILFLVEADSAPAA
jgi:hypothetical protein